MIRRVMTTLQEKSCLYRLSKLSKATVFGCHALPFPSYRKPLRPLPLLEESHPTQTACVFETPIDRYQFLQICISALISLEVPAALVTSASGASDMTARVQPSNSLLGFALLGRRGCLLLLVGNNGVYESCPLFCCDIDLLLPFSPSITLPLASLLLLH